MAEVAPDPNGPPLLAVCKTLSDQHAGRISLCKVVSGTITPDLVLVNPRTRAEERLHVLEALRGHETTPVRDAVAVGIPDKRFGEVVAAVVEPATSPPPTERDLVDYVKGRLAGFKAPKRVRFVESIERSPAGKIDYARHRSETAEWAASA